MYRATEPPVETKGTLFGFEGWVFTQGSLAPGSIKKFERYFVNNSDPSKQESEKWGMAKAVVDVAPEKVRSEVDREERRDELKYTVLGHFAPRLRYFHHQQALAHFARLSQILAELRNWDSNANTMAYIQAEGSNGRQCVNLPGTRSCLTREYTKSGIMQTKVRRRPCKNVLVSSNEATS